MFGADINTCVGHIRKLTPLDCGIALFFIQRHNIEPVDHTLFLRPYLIELGVELVFMLPAGARSVAILVVDQGIAGSRINTKGFGEEKPLNDNSTEAKRQLNRRVEFIVKKK